MILNLYLLDICFLITYFIDMEIEHKFDDGEKGKGLLMEEADEINPLQEFCSWLPLIKDANIPKTNLKLKQKEKMVCNHINSY